jgi:hypothetical protein
MLEIKWRWGTALITSWQRYFSNCTTLFWWQASCSPDTYHHGRQFLPALAFLMEKAQYESKF